MAAEVVMPRLGWNMESGSVASWRKKSGDTVTVGEVLFEVESDKATQEVEAQEDGVLHIPPESPVAGAVVPVGTLLAWLLKPGEAVPPDTGARPAPERAVSPRSASPAVQVAPPPSASSAPPLAVASVAGRRVAISPRAKRAARELHVDWGALTGSGSAGRIVERDVRTAAASARAAFPQVLIATMSTEADATELMRLGKQIESPGIAATTVVVARMAIQALRERPALAARAPAGGPPPESPARPPSFDVALAVPVESGLLAPVIRDASSRNLRALAQEASDLAARSRGGHLKPGELGGAVLAVLDLGAQEVDAFTPVLPIPCPVMLGIGRIVARAVVTDAERGVSAVRHMVTLSLAYESHLAHAGVAASFLQAVKRYVEDPYLCLAGA